MLNQPNTTVPFTCDTHSLLDVGANAVAVLTVRLEFINVISSWIKENDACLLHTDACFAICNTGTLFTGGDWHCSLPALSLHCFPFMTHCK
jgi:hypothetical protein